ncbi:MAG: hypothetical protein R8K49_08095 [Mariprofundaceae bacterium]
MKKVQYTFWYDFDVELFESKWSGSRGEWGWPGPRGSNFKKVMRKLSADMMDAENWKILSITPITEGYYNGGGLTNGTGNGSWGAGYGYGTSFTKTLVVLVEKDVSEVVFEKLKELSKQADEALNNTLKESISHEKGGMIKSAKWFYNNSEFASESAAIKARKKASEEAYNTVMNEYHSLFCSC